MLFVVGEVGATAGSLGSILSEQEGFRGSSPGAVSGAWVTGAGVEWAPGGGRSGGATIAAVHPAGERPWGGVSG